MGATNITSPPIKAARLLESNSTATDFPTLFDSAALFETVDEDYVSVSAWSGDCPVMPIEPSCALMRLYVTIEPWLEARRRTGQRTGDLGGYPDGCELTLTNVACVAGARLVREVSKNRKIDIKQIRAVYLFCKVFNKHLGGLL